MRINPGNAKAIERLAALQGVGDTGSLRESRPAATPARREEPVRAGTDLLSQRMSTIDEEPPEEVFSEPERVEAAPAFEEQAAFVPDAEFDDDVEYDEEGKPKRSRRAKFFRFVMIILALLVIGGGVSFLVFFRDSIPIFNRPASQPQEQAAVVEEPTATETTEDGLRALPATWTPTASSTPTQTPIPTATFTRTPPPTPLPLAPEIQELVNGVQQQVSELRGLPIQTQPFNNIVSQSRVEQVIRDEYIDGLVVSELEDEKRILVALGLVAPEYDLVTYALNSRADNIGGFYLPERDEIYVIGFDFGGLEKWVYAHEFTHALQDQNYDLTSYGVYPSCENGVEACKAFQALAEGDASLLAEQWLTRHATGTDLQDILAYTPPPSLFLDEFPPPYVARDLAFPYLEGREFVEAIFNQGGWEGVNAAYDAPPATTEQILHPQKFLDGEDPFPMNPINLTGALGNDWRLLRDDSLGEWMTFLILGYGADVATQAQEDNAKLGAEGWNGDRLAVYYNGTNDELVLAAHWHWDSSEDAEEFFEQFENYLDRRYDGLDVDGLEGALCWDADTEAVCFLAEDEETLWLMAPSLDMMDDLFDEIDFGA